MKLLDVNVLIYATDARSAHHSTARPWLLETLGSSETVGVPLAVELLGVTGTAGNLVSDAHLAALAIEHGAELCSYDTDFARFPGLDWLHPGQQ